MIKISGGSVLSTLLETKNEQIQESAISVLVRQEDQARILAVKGLNTILFRDLDDVETLNRVASEHDGNCDPILQYPWQHDLC